MGKSKFFVFIFSILCVGLCVVAANLLSSAITVSGKAVSSSGFSELKVFAISLGEFTSESQAKTLAEQISKKGGAGFVYKTDNLFYVLASAYEEENDAKLVQKNLSEAGTTSNIIEISCGIPEFKDVSSTQQKKAFQSALTQLKSTFILLYDISVSLDTGAIDETKAKIEIIDVNSQLETILKKTSKGTSAIDGIYYQQISNTFSEIEDCLNVLKNYESIDGVSLSSKIKNGYLSVVDKTKDLIELINNEI